MCASQLQLNINAHLWKFSSIEVCKFGTAQLKTYFLSEAIKKKNPAFLGQFSFLFVFK